MSKSDKTNCISDAINKEDIPILSLESNVKGFRLGLIFSTIIAIAIILIFIFNPVALDPTADDSSMFNLKSKIIYITISTVVFFICVFLLGKMFLKVSQGTSTLNDNKMTTIASVLLGACSLIIIAIISFSNEFKQKWT